MSALPDLMQTTTITLLAVAAMVAAAPQLFVDWFRQVAERQRAAMLRQQAIQEDLLRRLALRDRSGASGD